MDETHEATLRWPYPDANDVIVSGDFDQWSNSVHLTKDSTGFEAKVRIPWGTKVEYKFLVDGTWRTRDDVPTERDPSGKYVNNAYTAPPRPASTISSAYAYVASTFSTLTGTGVDPSEVDAKTPIDPTSPQEPPAAKVAPSIPASEPVVEPTTTEAAPTAEDSIPKPIAILPVKDASNDLQATSPSVPAETKVPDVVAAPAAPEPEVSTHTPASPPTSAPAENLTNGIHGQISTSEPAAEPAAVPAETETAPAATPAPVPTPAAPTPAASEQPKAETPVTAPPATPSKTDEKPSTNGKESPEATLTAARASLSKKPFPASDKDESDKTSSKGRSFSSSSIGRKRRSVFGGPSEGDDGDSSKYGSSPRKKKHSFFGKIKHMFDHKD